MADFELAGHPGVYRIERIDEIASPRLLVFRDRVEENVDLMRRHLEAVAPGSGFTHLRTHVKTNKSSWTARLMLERGITRFKATPNEVDMLLVAGARDIDVAYPLLPHQADVLARRIAAHPEVRLTAQVGQPRHVDDLAAAAARHEVSIDCLVDVDVGMHRTGAAPEDVPALCERLAAAKRLRFAGLHAYDGHNKGATDAERRATAEGAMDTLLAVVEAVRGAAAGPGVALERLVAGGTPGFLADLEILRRRAPPEIRIEVSPGTWIYWDTNYDARMPGLFRLAALVLARVMDRSGPDLLTLDLGYKRWAIDAGPVTLFSEPGLEVVGTSEEHTVCRRRPAAGGGELAVGDPVLIAPRHVCSTVNLWETFTVIGPGGEIEVEDAPVDARNR